jgi:hypothetical protein
MAKALGITWGKCLVELGHDTANADVIFDEVSFHARICEVKGSLDACYTRAHNHYSADFFTIF